MNFSDSVGPFGTVIGGGVTGSRAAGGDRLALPSFPADRENSYRRNWCPFVLRPRHADDGNAAWWQAALRLSYAIKIGGKSFSDRSRYRVSPRIGTFAHVTSL